MNEKLGCLGTVAALAACVGVWLIWTGSLESKGLGLLLAAPAAIFVAVRIYGASQRRER